MAPIEAGDAGDALSSSGGEDALWGRWDQFTAEGGAFKIVFVVLSLAGLVLLCRWGLPEFRRLRGHLEHIHSHARRAQAEAKHVADMCAPAVTLADVRRSSWGGGLSAAAGCAAYSSDRSIGCSSSSEGDASVGEASSRDPALEEGSLAMRRKRSGLRKGASRPKCAALAPSGTSLKRRCSLASTGTSLGRGMAAQTPMSEPGNGGGGGGAPDTAVATDRSDRLQRIPLLPWKDVVLAKTSSEMKRVARSRPKFGDARDDIHAHDSEEARRTTVADAYDDAEGDDEGGKSGGRDGAGTAPFFEPPMVTLATGATSFAIVKLTLRSSDPGVPPGMSAAAASALALGSLAASEGSVLPGLPLGSRKKLTVGNGLGTRNLSPRVAKERTIERAYMLHSLRRTASQTELDALLKEASQLRALRHPGLLRIFAAVAGGAGGDELGLISELCEAPLSRILADNVRSAAPIPAIAAAAGVGAGEAVTSGALSNRGNYSQRGGAAGGGSGAVAGMLSARARGGAAGAAAATAAAFDDFGATRDNVLTDSVLGEGGPGGLSWRGGLLAIATDVAQALAFLHENGVVHGGMLLNDVMITAGWRAKLCEYAMDGLRGGRGAAASGYEILSSWDRARGCRISAGANGGGGSLGSGTAEFRGGGSGGSDSSEVGLSRAASVLFIPPERCSGAAPRICRHQTIADVASAAAEAEPSDKLRGGGNTRRCVFGGCSSKTVGIGSNTPAAKRAAAVAAAGVIETATTARTSVGGVAQLAPRRLSVTERGAADHAQGSALVRERARPRPEVSPADAGEVARLVALRAAREGDAWSFGVLLCTLALHTHGQRHTPEQQASLLYMGAKASKSNDTSGIGRGAAGSSCSSNGHESSSGGKSTSRGGGGDDSGHAARKSKGHQHRKHGTSEDECNKGDGHHHHHPHLPHFHMHMPHMPHFHHRHLGHLGKTSVESNGADGHQHQHHLHLPHMHMPHFHVPHLPHMHMPHFHHRHHGHGDHGNHDNHDNHGKASGAAGPAAAVAVADASLAVPLKRATPRHFTADGPSPYMVMLRLCQGKLSPLDGVSLANCPKPLLRLASRCCALDGMGRPNLSFVSEELTGPILSLLDPNCLEARRPETPLRGWRAAVAVANPPLVEKLQEAVEAERNIAAQVDSARSVQAAPLPLPLPSARITEKLDRASWDLSSFCGALGGNLCVDGSEAAAVPPRLRTLSTSLPAGSGTHKRATSQPEREAEAGEGQESRDCARGFGTASNTSEGAAPCGDCSWRGGLQCGGAEDAALAAAVHDEEANAATSALGPGCGADSGASDDPGAGEASQEEARTAARARPEQPAAVRGRIKHGRPSAHAMPAPRQSAVARASPKAVSSASSSSAAAAVTAVGGPAAKEEVVGEVKHANGVQGEPKVAAAAAARVATVEKRPAARPAAAVRGCGKVNSLLSARAMPAPRRSVASHHINAPKEQPAASDEATVAVEASAPARPAAAVASGRPECGGGGAGKPRGKSRLLTARAMPAPQRTVKAHRQAEQMIAADAEEAMWRRSDAAAPESPVPPPVLPAAEAWPELCGGSAMADPASPSACAAADSSQASSLEASTPLVRHGRRRDGGLATCRGSTTAANLQAGGMTRRKLGSCAAGDRGGGGTRGGSGGSGVHPEASVGLGRRNLVRMNSALYGFDEDTTKPEKEGPGRLRRVVKKVETACTAARMSRRSSATEEDGRRALASRGSQARGSQAR